MASSSSPPFEPEPFSSSPSQSTQLLPSSSPPPMDQAMEARFQQLNIANKGREYQDTTRADEFRQAPRTTTHTLPNITKTTRIIAVCGVADAKMRVKQEGKSNKVAAPDSDGWFISDFYAFKNLLKGAGSSQKWITSEDPRDLVNRFGTYLHGSEYDTRKEVLSYGVIKQPGFWKTYIKATRDNLRATFVEHLQLEANEARKHDQPLVIFVFAHGDNDAAFGMQIGHPSKANWFNIQDFKDIIGTGLRVTLFTSACFSGGWTIYEDFTLEAGGTTTTLKGQQVNATLMTAAGPMNQSESYAGSTSIGRFCGSFFATAMIQSFCAESEKAATTASSSSAQSSQTTYLAFTETVHDALFEIDKYAYQHQIRFSAQDDDWTSSFGDRTGIALSTFKQNWDQLVDVPSTATDQTFNRDNRGRSGHADDTAAPRGQFGSIRGRHDPIASQANFLCGQADFYLGSFPGKDTLSDNVTFHSMLKKFLDGKIEPTPDNIKGMYDLIMYRNHLMTVVMKVLELTRTPLPFGKTIMEFDWDEFWSRASPQTQYKCRNAWNEIKVDLLPKPILETGDPQGRPWEKPNWYLAAAVVFDPTSKTAADITISVAAMRRCYNAYYIDGIKKQIEKMDPVKKRKRAWFDSISKRMRSVSPDKQASRQSTGGGGSSGLGLIPDLGRSNSNTGKGKGKGKGKAPADR